MIIEHKESENLLLRVVKNASIEKISDAIAYTIDINERDDRDWTALMIAVERDDVRIIELLLEAGAYVNACDYAGWTPLLLAANRGTDPRIISLLLEAGADVYARNREYKNVLDLASNNPALQHTDQLKRLYQMYVES